MNNNPIPIVEPLNRIEAKQMRAEKKKTSAKSDSADVASLGRAQQTRGLAERDEFDKKNSKADHTLKPGDGTVPVSDPQKQTREANDFGTSQAPQEEFIDQSN